MDEAVKPPVVIDVEDLGVRADEALFANQRLPIDLLVMLARKITGPFGGYIQLKPEEQEAAHGYRLRFYIKGVDQLKNGKATYNIEVTPPPGWKALPTKQGAPL